MLSVRSDNLVSEFTKKRVRENAHHGAAAWYWQSSALCFSLTDDDTPAKAKKKKKRGPNLKRDFEAATTQIMNDYFLERPLYPERVFRRRFRMSKALFEEVHDAVVSNDPYFRRKPGTRAVC